MEYETFIVSPVSEQDEINIAIAHIRGAMSVTAKELSFGEELRISVCTNLKNTQVTLHNPTTEEEIVFSKEATPNLSIFKLRTDAKSKFLEQLDDELYALGFNAFSDEWAEITTYSQKVVKRQDYELPEDLFLYETFLETIARTNSMVSEALETIDEKINLAAKVSAEGESIQIIITNTLPLRVYIASHGVEIAVFPAPKNLPTPKIFKERTHSQIYFKNVLAKVLKGLGFLEIYDSEANSVSYTHKV